MRPGGFYKRAKCKSFCRRGSRSSVGLNDGFGAIITENGKVPQFNPHTFIGVFTLTRCHVFRRPSKAVKKVGVEKSSVAAEWTEWTAAAVSFVLAFNGFSGISQPSDGISGSGQRLNFCLATAYHMNARGGGRRAPRPQKLVQKWVVQLKKNNFFFGFTLLAVTFEPFEPEASRLICESRTTPGGSWWVGGWHIGILVQPLLLYTTCCDLLNFN